MIIPRSSYIWYGRYAQGKTLLAGQLADYVHDVTDGKMITRLYSADGGGDATIQDKIDEGKIEVWHLAAHPYTFEALDRVSKAWWPEDMSDPVNSLRPPTTETWDKVGARVYEGLTSFTSAMYRRINERIEDGQISVNPDTNNRYEKPPVHFKDGTTMIIGVPTGMYGTIFSRIERYVSQSVGLPGSTAWTAREKEVEDKKIGDVVGPALVGTKLTSEVPSWFYHTLRLSSEEGWVPGPGGKKVVGNIYKVYIQQHFDKDNPRIPYLCGLRLPASIDHSQVPKFIVNDLKHNVFKELAGILKPTKLGVNHHG